MTSTAVIACGALSRDLNEIISTRNLEIDLFEIDALLHNSPKKIPLAVEEQIEQLNGQYSKVILAYADCGTYGGLDEICQKYQLPRLRGNHCYDVYAGSTNLKWQLESEPGTYILTDFLVTTFERSVNQELGIDRYPHLREDYFKNYTRLLWLAQNPTDELTSKAMQIAHSLGLPLEIQIVGVAKLAEQLLALLDSSESDC